MTWQRVAFAAGSAGVLGSFLLLGGRKSQELERYTAEEVACHDGRQTDQVWVTYGKNVYDISSFLKEHPGGEDFIRQASGGALEPFWAYWAYHTSFDRAVKTLEKYRIGLLKEGEDAGESVELLTKDFYQSDPVRSDDQTPFTLYPWSSETKLNALRSHFTSNASFYVRNHAPVPELDEESFSMEVTGPDGRVRQIDCSGLRDSSRLPWTRIRSVLQCAGNRAADMNALKATAFTGTPYEHIGCGMIGNAEWSGVRLSDLLRYLIRDIDTIAKSKVYHVEFEGADGYKTSTPLRRIMDPSYDAILALEMNGSKLPPDHGFPVRVLLPGIAGARSVKWVTAIRIREEECESCWQKGYYLNSSGQAIQEMPVQSFIISKAKKTNESTVVEGVAWGGGDGSGVSKVMVSADGGKCWTEACLRRETSGRNENSSRRWEWVHWHCEINQPVDSTFMCKATNNSGEEQPEKPWNPKGYQYNGWHSL